MAKSSKVTNGDQTPEEKELEQWETHLKNLGIKPEDEPHVYSEKMALLKQRAADSRKSQAVETDL